MKEETYWKTPTGITKTRTPEEYKQAEELGYKRYLTEEEFLTNSQE